MRRRPPRSTRTDTLFPYTTLFRSSNQPIMRLLDRTRFSPLRLPRTLNLRSEEHTSELQSLMRTSYAVFCLKKKKRITRTSRSVSPPHCILKRSSIAYHIVQDIYRSHVITTIYIPHTL